MKFKGTLGSLLLERERFNVKRFVSRSVAAVAMFATLSVGIPALATAGTTSTATTTVVITTMRQYRAALKVYEAELNLINETFILAVSNAKATYAASLSGATSSSARISARSTYRSAIAAATLARATALTALGKAPVKPKTKSLKAIG